MLVARCSRTICHQGDIFIGKCYFNVNRLTSDVSKQSSNGKARLYLEENMQLDRKVTGHSLLRQNECQ